jgi:beta-glucosidase
MDYKEKLLVGYKWYDKKKIEPLFPFGHGLSYSKFELKKVSLLKKKHEIKIKVKLKNIGNFSTFETVQCYLERKKAKAETPTKKLVDFKKLKLPKDKSEKLTLKISKRDLSEWDVKKSKWEIVKGDYVIHVGTSVRDISITEEVKI